MAKKTTDFRTARRDLEKKLNFFLCNNDIKRHTTLSKLRRDMTHYLSPYGPSKEVDTKQETTDYEIDFQGEMLTLECINQRPVIFQVEVFYTKCRKRGRIYLTEIHVE